MRCMILALSLIATPVLAMAEEPTTLILPTPVVNAMAQYLSQRPYAEVAQMMAVIQGCVAVQVPNAQGVTTSHGECPAVTAALQTKPTPAVKSTTTPP